MSHLSDDVLKKKTLDILQLSPKDDSESSFVASCKAHSLTKLIEKHPSVIKDEDILNLLEVELRANTKSDLRRKVVELTLNNDIDMQKLTFNKLLTNKAILPYVKEKSAENLSFAKEDICKILNSSTMKAEDFIEIAECALKNRHKAK